MHGSRKKPSNLKSLIGFAILAGAYPAAHAGEINVASDQLVITAAGGFGGATPTIGNDGIVGVGEIAGLPSPAGAFPDFSLTLESNNTANGTYTFAAGFIIDDDNSDTRLEISIPTVNMTFSNSGADITGSITGSAATMIGRNNDSSATVTNTTLPNSFFSFAGNVLTLDAGAQIAAVEAEGGLFASIINSVDVFNEGHYDYAVFLKQLSGPEALNFGTITGVFTEFAGCAPANAFLLNGGLAATFSGAYALQGEFSIGTPGDADITSPTAFISACTPIVTPPGGGGAPPPAEGSAADADVALADEIAGITVPASGPVSAAVVTQIDTALNNTDTLVDLTLADLASDDLSVDDAVGIIDTLNSSLELAGEAIQAGATLNLGTISDIIDGIGDVIAALDDGGTLTPLQLTQLASTTLSTLDAIRDLIADDADPDSTADILDQAGDVVNAAINVGVDLSTTLTDAAASLSESILERALDDIAEALGSEGISFTSVSAAQTLLGDNPTLLAEVVDVTALSIGGVFDLDEAASQTAIEAGGVSSGAASNLVADLSAFIDPTGLSIDIGTETFTALDLVAAAIPGGSTATVDGTTGAIVISSTGGDVQAFVSDIALVPESVPSGQFIRPDGSLLSISDGIAITLVPSPADPVELVAAIEDVGGGDFTTDLLANGAFSLTDTISGAVFSATFSLDAVTAGTPVTDTTFGTPSGDPADADYAFTVTFTDGSLQQILPMILSPLFFDSVTALGFGIEVDRATGIIDIDGFRFKPDFFQRPLTSEEFLFRLQNGDSSGVAYRALDANGDEFTDYQIITTAGAQVVYALQP